MTTSSLEPLVYTLDQACEALGGIARDTLRDLIAENRIPTFRAGRRILISRDALRLTLLGVDVAAMIESMPPETLLRWLDRDRKDPPRLRVVETQ